MNDQGASRSQLDAQERARFVAASHEQQMKILRRLERDAHPPGRPCAFGRTQRTPSPRTRTLPFEMVPLGEMVVVCVDRLVMALPASSCNFTERRYKRPLRRQRVDCGDLTTSQTEKYPKRTLVRGRTRAHKRSAFKSTTFFQNPLRPVPVFERVT
jgi:hypothetical protein